jgi:hypothetical protein
MLCRGGGIRTHDLYVPNVARYQAALHPVWIANISESVSNPFTSVKFL